MNLLGLNIHRLLHWEYWPMRVVYYPLFPAWFYLAIRARSFFFFNAANPGIRNGGMAMESKKEIYDLIPSQFIPKTILINKSATLDEVMASINKAMIRFPLIVKPDVGMKAFGVEKICTQSELQSYFNKASQDSLIQEFIDYPNEIGIFYIRYPGEDSGKITGIVAKDFLSVCGDGTHSLEQLIKNNPRTYFQWNTLKTRYMDKLDMILPKGKSFTLIPFGSHTRGAKFSDITHLTNEKLVNRIDEICRSVPGFFFGRMDIKYSSFDELSRGEKFKIIEINGAGSEPTHMYDPGHSLVFAWKEIIRHWLILYKISSLNHKRGIPYLSFKDGWAMLRANRKLESSIKMI